MRRHELSDEGWERIKKHFPKRAATGRAPRDHRLMLNGILWILRTGAPWRDLPERFGPWETVYGRFRTWRKTGLFTVIMNALLRELSREGLIDRELWCIDGSVIRAHRVAAGAEREAGSAEDQALGRSQGGFSTKIHILCDAKGVPLAATLTPGQTHESKAFEATMSATLEPVDVGTSTQAPKARRRRQGVQPPLDSGVAETAPDERRDRATLGSGRAR